MTRVGSRFRRVEPRRRARAFALGLLAELPRVNCWTVAEHAGDSSPDGMQHLLARAKRDADGVRDDARGYVPGHLGDPGAVLVVGETGDLKKGTATAGVQRQYTGTADRIENAQVAVYLGYSAPAGHALIDRELYLPKPWTGDPERCAAAGIPQNTAFATKPQLAGRMTERAAAAGVASGWVAGDEACGDNGPLRAWLEERDIAHVLAVACHHRVPAGAGPALRADELAARLLKRAWQQLPAGEGAKGKRYHDWTRIMISDSRPGHRHLLTRRNRSTGELAFTAVTARIRSRLAPWRRSRGSAGRSRRTSRPEKGLTGLDEHQARRWTSWYRWAARQLHLPAAPPALARPAQAGEGFPDRALAPL